MILLLICIAIVIGFGVYGAAKVEPGYYNKPDRVDGFMAWFVGALMIVGCLYLLSQTFLGMLNVTSTQVTYTQKLVSLNDGKGLEGQIYGGVFMTTGYVNDTQHFAYYREVAPGQYALDKRDARQSTILTDATAETARVDITDTVYDCKTTWYSTWCFANPAEFTHADFHVPANSIKESFELDAR